MSLRSRLGFSAEPLYLMDGSAFIFRGFYAFRNMARSDGFPTNALYIVARLLLRLVREERPAHFAFVMDGRGPTFRHKKFPAYKAQRSATPEPLVQQLGPIKEFIEALGLPLVVSEGCEADDCIASLAARFREERPVVILGADKDLKQCLHRNVVLWDPSGKEEKITSLEDFTAETGMQPSSWPDYQALVGDSSDNIPGIPKIGPKSALELIKEFPTLEELFRRLPAVPPKVREKLEGRKDDALLYRELTTLSCSVCPSLALEDLTAAEPALSGLLAFMGQYELRALAREVESMSRAGIFGRGPAPLAPPALNGDLMAPPRAGGDKATSAASEFSAAPSAEKRAESALPLFASTPEKPSKGRMVQQSLFGDAAAPAVPVQALDENGLARLREALAKNPAASLAFLKAETGLLTGNENAGGLWAGGEDALRPLISQGSGALVTDDLKALSKKFPKLFQAGKERWFDLSLAGWLLSPEERGYELPDLLRRFQEAADLNTEESSPPAQALALHKAMLAQLQGAHLEEVLRNLEQPLAPLLGRLEARGITIDKEAFARFLEETQKELDALTERIHSLAGKTFNIRSSAQLSDLLFVELGLPKAGKTKGGASSTSQDVLEKLQDKHPVIESILEYRKLEKLRSTYLEPLPRLADAQNRLHTTLNQTATATGRLSSANPNLQNIPVRGPLGSRMRACFTAAPGRLLVCADYSQIELRVLAHLSGDPTLLDAFRNNEDIHRRTAALLFDVPGEAVTPDQRRNAKTINFGLVYGMGAQKLAQELRISMKEAKAFIDRYFERLSVLKKFYDTVEEEAKTDGCVSTMTGRRRFLPEIHSQNNQLKSQARRQAINTRIQGSAADIIKLAMPAVENDAELARLNAVLLLQIHDELLLEVPPENAEAAGNRLAVLMSEVKPGGQALSVPLPADWGVGKTWAEAHG